MASAQVKKKEHLEAGKKKLEEFRKKKAAEKAKKNISDSQPPHASDVPHEKQPSETERIRITDYTGAVTSVAPVEDHVGHPTVVPDVVSKGLDTSIKIDFSPCTDTSTSKTSLLAKRNDIRSPVQEQSYLNDDGYKDEAGFMDSDRISSAKDHFQNRKDGADRTLAEVVYTLGNDYTLDHHISSIQEARSSSHFIYHGSDNYLPINTVACGNDLSAAKSDSILVFTSDNLSKNSIGTLQRDKLRNSRNEANSPTSSPFQESFHSTSSMAYSAVGLEQKSSGFSGMAENKFRGATDLMGSKNHSSPWTSDHMYADSNFDTRSSPDVVPTSPPAAGRRFRPSFLDTIHISKGPSSSLAHFDKEKADKINSKKENEDFAALEQHIEDLTQEKFSLQRALEASRSLAESLASENSVLTDSFNQQGGVINQLRSDLEKLEDKLKVQMVELEAVNIEHANAQLECNAADERAKLLAAEVIGLEEKALRLRSNELKLERQLENSQTEISSYRNKMSTLEKDRQDLLSTIDALKEEKKLLQSKIRKASSGVKSIDVNNISDSKKNVSTSTEDLDSNTILEFSNSDSLGTALLGNQNSGFQLSHEYAYVNLEVQNMAIPPEQMRMIQNIKTLLAELALEKGHLMQALSAESSQSCKLLELNNELTRKLEAQTQRLELLMAQSMAINNTQPKKVDPRTVHESTRYADEGDEVVERVLGWIMKLFPGGPSKGRPGKHL